MTGIRTAEGMIREGATARLRGIFFDLDDTLIGYTEAERRALSAGCRLAAQINPEINERALGAAIYEVYARGYSYGTPGFAELGTLPVTEFRFRLTDAALRRFGVSDPALTGALVDAYAIAERAALRAFPHVAETLRLLRPHFRLGVITNGPSAMQREKLAVLALEGLFEEIVVDTEFGHPKPDARIFDHAARLVGLAPAELMFVGNSLEADIAGARTAGWASVWMREPRAPEPAAGVAAPDFTIRDIAEVPHLPPVAAVLNTAAAANAAAHSPAKDTASV
jgi:putative hydrolase of the HAD superfamily